MPHFELCAVLILKRLMFSALYIFTHESCHLKHPFVYSSLSIHLGNGKVPHWSNLPLVIWGYSSNISVIILAWGISSYLCGLQRMLSLESIAKGNFVCLWAHQGVTMNVSGTEFIFCPAVYFQVKSKWGWQLAVCCGWWLDWVPRWLKMTPQVTINFIDFQISGSCLARRLKACM